jgi:GTP pyrophosphokinase
MSQEYAADTNPNRIVPLEEIISHATRYHPRDDMEIISRAYAYAQEAHAGQVRMSGEPYFSHPTNVALILADIMMDPATIAAGLLHDVVEDVEGVTSETIEKLFSAEIGQMVDGVTKLNHVDFFSKHQQKTESIRKMFMAMAKEIRVVLIKLADRLHNMRTLDTQKPQRRQDIAQETLDIYAPLAHRLGVYGIKSELEDLCLKYLDPAEYLLIKQQTDAAAPAQQKLISDIKNELKTALDAEGLKGYEISGRIKHTYSIYRKMKAQNKTYDQIMDLVAVRVVVEQLSDCYSVLGIVHSIWKPMPDRIKDYIHSPKYGIYQSLHTTVVDNKDGQRFEVQIRTFEMHQNAEYGIAAHWRYKEGRAADELDDKLSWLRRIIDWSGEAGDADEFSSFLRTDLFSDDVFVFTPAGDIISLPKGATPIDFAYRIHTAVGNRCVGARVDKKMVPLSTQLESGNVIEIITSSTSKGPSLDWLNIVKTGEAKAKIRSYLKNASKDENLARGRDMLEREMKRLGYSYPQLFRNEYLEPLYKRYSLSNIDDLYVTVGFGGLSCAQVLNRLADEYKKTVKAEPKKPDAADKAPAKTVTHATQGVEVEGDSGMLIKFARCCNPLPGDSIVGYVTRGRGVSIHRADCANMMDESIEPDRFVRVSWAGQNTEAYEAEIEIRGYDKAGLLGDLSNLFASLNVPMLAVSARSLKNGTSQISLTLQVKDTAQLDKVIKQLQKRSDIIEVFRTGM